jgi:predicted nucleotidyltransferase
MSDTARPATVEDLKRLLQALHEQGAEYLLVGAFALAAHGYQRATTGIDLLVPGHTQSGERLKRALLTLPEGVAAEFDPVWLEEGGTVRVADAFVVDLLVNANGHSYEELLPRAVTGDLDGVPVRTLDLEGLLLTKQTMRAKDEPDRLMLERALAHQRRERGSQP